MPRKRNPTNEDARSRQERYRQRLAIRKEAEVQVLDTACAVALAQLVVDVEKGRSFPTIKEVLNRALMASVDDLEIKGYSRPLSARLLKRRLSGLKSSLLRGM